MLSTPIVHGQQDDRVRINEIQMIGTHNSYHAGLPPSAGKLLREKNPKVFAALNYRHPSLTTQLNEGVRQMEIDVFADPEGGLYSHPYIERMVAAAGLPPDPPYNQNGVMDKPGFKVMHRQDIDQRSVCEPFTDCLAEIQVWSKAHPRHLPIFLLIETKQRPLKVKFPSVQPIPFTSAVFDVLDRAILSVFPVDELITPDDVRGRYPTLNAAVRAGQWPTLAKARGKIVFLMDQRPMEPLYTEGHPSLRGRVLFTNGTPGEPDAAFTEANGASPEVINELVREGYLVRTRTDGAAQARYDDTRRRDAMKRTGAQILSTDYPRGEAARSGYVVEFSGGALVRCNPVLRALGCTDSELLPEKERTSVASPQRWSSCIDPTISGHGPSDSGDGGKALKFPQVYLAGCRASAQAFSLKEHH